MNQPGAPSADAAAILAAVLDASDDAIVTTDLTGTVLSWNRGAENIYGYRPGEAVGGPFSLVIQPDQIEAHGRLVRRVADGARVGPSDSVHITKNGLPIQVALSMSPIHDAVGSVIGVTAIVRDNTARERAERGLRGSEARSQAIVEAAVDAIILIDRHGAIESFNPAAERLFQYEAAEIIGRNVSLLMPQPYSAEHGHYLRRFLVTGTAHIIGVGREVTAQRKDGSTFPAHLSVAQLNVEGEIKFTGIVRDLTERVKLEMRLREESGLVRLGELAAVLAHEVKNPLAAVSGAVQVLGEKLPDTGDRVIVMEILRRLDGLAAMMGDLLLYARPPKPRFGPVDLMALIDSLVAFFRLDPAWLDIECEVRGTVPPLTADAELLKVALQNLLINACQAMSGRGRLSVVVEQLAGVVCIDVTDSGLGMPAEAQAKLFTPFFTTKSRGTGLGLATVRRIAEAHKGEVRLLSTGPKGTTMRLSLPAWPGS